MIHGWSINCFKNVIFISVRTRIKLKPEGTFNYEFFLEMKYNS